MLQYKCFLVREFMHLFQLKHARTLLDHIDQKIQIPNKFNILVSNFNVVLSACLLIELLGLVEDKFEQLKVRCDTIRARIETHIEKYMDLVNR